jgi:hypothetical protein
MYPAYQAVLGLRLNVTPYGIGSNGSKITADFPGFASQIVNFQNYFTHYQENKN